jgi:hypothetical protein
MTNFVDSINVTEALLQEVRHGVISPAEAESKIGEMLNSMDTARGFFVSLLTGESNYADEPPAWLCNALNGKKPVVAELLTKNLVMSTTMNITHLRAGKADEAAKSQKVANRVRKVMKACMNSDLNSEIRAMLESIRHKRNNATSERLPRYVEFLSRWSYDREQLNAAETALLDSQSTAD